MRPFRQIIGEQVMRLWGIVLTVILVLVPGNAAADAAKRNGRFVTVFGPALPPVGYRAFCERHRRDCVLPKRRRAVAMTAARRDQLETVNVIVNRTVKPVSDWKLYGRHEVWAYPRRAGDCEDYVLLKRRMLMKRGWPASALLITVVRDEYGSGHAVLTVRTTSGDFVLDNRLDEVVAWHALPYDFISRQSSFNPMSWVSLTPNLVPRFSRLGDTSNMWAR